MQANVWLCVVCALKAVVGDGIEETPGKSMVDVMSDIETTGGGGGGGRGWIDGNLLKDDPVNKKLEMRMLMDSIRASEEKILDSYDTKSAYVRSQSKNDVLKRFQRHTLSRKKRAVCGVRSKFSRRQKSKMLKTTKYFRSVGGAADPPKIKWTKSLTRRAQEWANECKWSFGMLTDCRGKDIAQNLMMVRTGQRYSRVNMKAVARKWFQRRNRFNKYSRMRQVGTGTSVSVKSAYMVGCGIAKCPVINDTVKRKSWKNAILVVCNYKVKKTMLPQALICTCAVLAATQVEAARKTAGDKQNNVCAALTCCSPDCPENRRTATHFQQNGRRCPGCPTCRDKFPTKNNVCGKMSCCLPNCKPEHQVKTYYFQSGRRCQGCSFCRVSGTGEYDEDKMSPKKPPTPPSRPMNACPSISCANTERYLTCAPSQRKPSIIGHAPDGSPCYGCDQCIGEVPPLPGIPNGCPELPCGEMDAHLNCPASEQDRDTFIINGITCFGCNHCKKDSDGKDSSVTGGDLSVQESPDKKPPGLSHPSSKENGYIPESERDKIRKKIAELSNAEEIPDWLKAILCENDLIPYCT